MNNASPVALTLLAATTLISIVAAGVWLSLGHVQPSMRRACWSLGGANALIALALMTNASRASWPGFWTYWGTDVTAISSFALLLQAVTHMDAHARDRRPGPFVAVLASAGLLLQPYGQGLLWHRVIVFGSLALLSGLMAWTAFKAMRSKVRLPMVGLVVGPLICMAMLMMGRVVHLLQAQQAALTLATDSSFNVMWLWFSLVLSLTLNATMAFLLLMRLISAIQRLTVHDPLTDVLNRRALSEAIEREHLRSRRGVPYSLVMLDMDRFKSLNDTHGHAAGDAALKALVAALKPCIRDVDSLGRLGGEEFSALLPDTEMAGAFLVAERMRANLEAIDFRWRDESWPLSASFGVAQSTPDDVDADDVLRRADHAMYQAKTQGRNLVQALER
jgi:diguanylate cyclase (GGDEF)-like protein